MLLNSKLPALLPCCVIPRMINSLIAIVTDGHSRLPSPTMDASAIRRQLKIKVGAMKR